jgi:protein-L-isoaspartate O-methyltransferase
VSVRWHSYAEQMTQNLAGRGVLAPGWRDAFARTPRHVFVPLFLDGENVIASHAEPALRQVYADTTLIAEPGHDRAASPLAVSVQPSLTAQMLGWLAADDGQRVLQVGIGTGYETGLLCQRLGEANVTSIDPDDQMMLTAKARLAGLGHRPSLLAGDVTQGAAASGPFERIISTVAVTCLPPAWITQLVPGGRIVAEVGGALALAVLVADKTSPSSVRGRFRDLPPQNAAAPAAPAAPPESPAGGWSDRAHARHVTTDEVPADAFAEHDFRFLLHLSVPGLGPVADRAPDGTPGVFLHAADGSWMLYQPTGRCAGSIGFGGPRSLWEQVDDLWQRWHRWHLPGVGRFGMTCYDDGRCHVWLDQEFATVMTVEPTS